MNGMVEAATTLVAIGFAIVWLRRGEKRPTRKRWTLASQTPADYTEGANLGIMTGVLSGNLVCVDLDHEEAIRRADEFLPPTGMIDGRQSKPRSHRFYIVTNIPPEEISKKGPGGGPRTRHFPGVDLLGTGAQVTVPPSVVKGETRTWEDPNGKPATITYAELRAAIDRLVAACSPPKRPVGRPRSARIDAGSVPAAINPSGPPQGTERPCVDPGASGTPTTTTPSCGPNNEAARAWFARHEPAVAGNNGRHRTYGAARVLVNDFALSVEDAWPILAEWNTSCVPPWDHDELRGILERAAAADPDPNHPRGCKLRQQRPWTPWNDPARLAREFHDAATWRLWNGTYWIYVGTHYEQQGEDDLMDAIALHAQAAADRENARQDVNSRSGKTDADLKAGKKMPKRARVSRSLIVDVLAHLRPMIKPPSTTRLPSFIGDASAPPLLAVRNGLLDLDALTLSPHNSAWFSRNCLPCDYDPAATAPRWAGVVARLLEEDNDRVALLQEWFGYCLWRGHQAQSFLILYGDGGTGKSTVLAALKAMIGSDNLSAVSFADIGSNRFAYAPMLGMMVNVSSDTSEIDRFTEGPFKSAVCGEAMSVEFKGVDAFTAHPTAKLVLATNVLPRFSDKTNGVWRRARHLPMNIVVPQSERVPGMDRESFWGGELPGILNWSLAGLRRLRDNNWLFATPAASAALAVEHRGDSDPARAYLLEHYTYDPSAGPVPMADVYGAYREWCRASGVNHPLMIRTFNRSVRQAFHNLDSAVVKYPKEHPRCGVHRSWVGLRQVAPVGRVLGDVPLPGDG